MALMRLQHSHAQHGGCFGQLICSAALSDAKLLPAARHLWHLRACCNHMPAHTGPYSCSNISSDLSVCLTSV